jgi:VWFA-related protein
MPQHRHRSRVSRVTETSLLLLVVGASCVGSVAAQGEGAVSFITPRNLATVLGPSSIELRVRAPAGLSVVDLEIHLDGKLLTKLTAEPWSVEWDAGDGSRGHKLEAIVHLSDGSELRARVGTTPLRINQVEEVDLVNLYPILRTESGHYVTDLTRDDFRILENDVPQEITHFSTEGKPLRIAIVLDTSYTMSQDKKLENAQKAALGFLEALGDEDQAMVVVFSDEVDVAQELTADPQLLASAIQRTTARGGTALYDAIWRTSRRLERYEGRRVLVLLSDGKDEASNGFEPGSLHTLAEAVDRALRSEVMVFSIGLGKRLDREYARQWSRPLGQPGAYGESLKDILMQLAETTGGRALFSPSPGQLRKAFKEVAEDLRNQYSIAYSSSDPSRGGEWREVRVETPGRDLTVISRRGYFATPPRTNVGSRSSD